MIPHTRRRLCVWLLPVLVALAGPADAPAETPKPAVPAGETVEFAKHVQPLLRAKCYSCHGADQSEGGLRLDVGKLALAGGDSGAAIVPGKSAESLLVRAVSGLDEDLQMPPEGEGAALAEAEVGQLRTWIDQGAVWPDQADGATAGRAPGSDHWAFQPIANIEPPRLDDPWAKNGIDAFILRRLRHEGVQPLAAADRWVLIRRLYLDLIGLPPSPAEWHRWMDDPQPDWYARLVDHLLASPHYGERWGRVWLDQARYADSDGYEKDQARPDAWRWRDWVIKALNDDMPFDQFTVAQIAGDLLPDATLAHRIATGLHRNTLVNREGGIDPEEDRVKRTVDRTNTLGSIWLGITVQCAQCHSHKYDPLTQREFFALYAFFNSLDEPDIPLAADRDPAPGTAKAAAGADTTAKAAATPAKVSVVAEMAEPRPTHVHLRGDFLSKGPAVQPGTPAALNPLKPRALRPDRLDLAHWLIDPANPLTARVAVNRVWQQVFGRGIVASSGDFGTQGERPSHPELLDWLATRFRQGGWRMKALHRLIVGSSTYRQSSHSRPELVDRDPYNTWLSHQNRQRVEAEIVRDLALAASGLLSTQIGGPSVRPPQPEGIAMLGYAGQVQWKTSAGTDRYRRGLYTFFQRTVPYPMLVMFDAPDSNTCCTQRERSNTPLQALTLWNDPVFVQCAQALARRLVRDVPAGADYATTTTARIRHAFLVCLSREPTADETADVRDLVRSQRAVFDSDGQSPTPLVGALPRPDGMPLPELAAWVVVARTLINLDEFITRE